MLRSVVENLYAGWRWAGVFVLELTIRVYVDDMKLHLRRASFHLPERTRDPYTLLKLKVKEGKSKLEVSNHSFKTETSVVLQEEGMMRAARSCKNSSTKRSCVRWF